MLTYEEGQPVPDRERMGELLDELRSARDEFEHRLTTIEGKVDTVADSIDRIKAEIGPKLPDPDTRGERDTIQWRLHEIKQDRQAFELIAAGLTDQLREVAPLVQQMRESQRVSAAIHASYRQIFRRAATGLGVLLTVLTILKLLSII